MIHQNGFSLGEFVQPPIEPETAVVLRDAVAREANGGVVAQAIGRYFLGWETSDYETVNNRGRCLRATTCSRVWKAKSGF